jgi:hypothetical protein
MGAAEGSASDTWKGATGEARAARPIGIDEAFGIMRSAFSPLRTVIEINESKTRLRIRVFAGAEAKPVITPLHLTMADAVLPFKLEALLRTARFRIEMKGHRLQPWGPAAPRRPRH